VRIAEPPAAPYQDPLARIDWNGIDRECWWLPPQALSLAGIAEFEALPLDARRRLSHYEYVHLLDIGLWLESLLVERFARLACRSNDFIPRMRYLQEIREEAGHSLMFIELIRRSGVRLPAARGALRGFADTLGRRVPSRSALFWAMVVIGEELPDRLNHRLQRGVEEVMLSAVVYRVAQVHGLDEADHSAYARARCEQETALLHEWQRALLSPVLSRIFDAFARYCYFPPAAVYRCSGLAPAAKWRARALRNPLRHEHVGAMLRPTLDFLKRIGWRMSSRYGPSEE
jgi:hypothetical protein